MSFTHSAIRLVPRNGHLQVIEHVVVGLARGLQLPGLLRGERIQGQLDVVFQLLRGLRAGGLVVDQLVLIAHPLRPLRQTVDAVDAPAQMVGPEPEGERALEPHRL